MREIDVLIGTWLNSHLQNLSIEQCRTFHRQVL